MRCEGWELRLAAEIEAAKRRPFEWGRHDCAGFALRCAEAQLGRVPPSIRRLFRASGGWSDALGARRALRALGAADLAAALDLAAERVPILAARRGDLAAVPAPPGPAGALALAVVEGGGLWAAADPGLARLPVSAAAAAWSLESLLCRQSPQSH